MMINAMQCNATKKKKEKKKEKRGRNASKADMHAR